MDGKVIEGTSTADHAQNMRVQREKVFGIGDSERWSGSEKLIDFLDELLGPKLPVAKLEHPVSLSAACRLAWF